MRSFTRFLAVLLVGCLVLPFAGTRLWMGYAQHAAKRAAKTEILRGLPTSQLVQLSFSVEEAKRVLEWEEADEFAYHGKMYDLIERRREGDCLIFLCWHDEAETEVKRRMQELSQLRWQHHPNRTQQQARLLLFVQRLIAPELPGLFIKANLHHLSQPFARLPFPGPPVTIDPPSPPPRVAAYRL